MCIFQGKNLGSLAERHDLVELWSYFKLLLLCSQKLVPPAASLHRAVPVHVNIETPSQQLPPQCGPIQVCHTLPTQLSASGDSNQPVTAANVPRADLESTCTWYRASVVDDSNPGQWTTHPNSAPRVQRAAACCYVRAVLRSRCWVQNKYYDVVSSHREYKVA